jgi:hypothetical protein
MPITKDQQAAAMNEVWECAQQTTQDATQEAATAHAGEYEYPPYVLLRLSPNDACHIYAGSYEMVCEAAKDINAALEAARQEGRDEAGKVIARITGVNDGLRNAVIDDDAKITALTAERDKLRGVLQSVSDLWGNDDEMVTDESDRVLIQEIAEALRLTEQQGGQGDE